MSTWKRDIASGLVVLLPLGILLFVVNWLYVRIIGLPLISNLDFAELGVPDSLVPLTRILVALALIVTLILAVGYLMRTTAGRVFEATIDDTINRVPGLRVVYNASKLAVETALSGTDDLQQPVRLEVWDGIRMTAFKTGKRTDDGKIVLFLPTAPNITTGYVMEVDPERVEDTGEKSRRSTHSRAERRVRRVGSPDPCRGGIQPGGHRRRHPDDRHNKHDRPVGWRSVGVDRRLSRATIRTHRWYHCEGCEAPPSRRSRPVEQLMQP